MPSSSSSSLCCMICSVMIIVCCVVDILSLSFVDDVCMDLCCLYLSLIVQVMHTRNANKIQTVH
jgi:hypothetical protein